MVFIKLYNVKKMGKVTQAFGLQYQRIGAGLIPTEHTIACTIIRDSIPISPGDIVASFAEITSIVPDNNPGSFDLVNFYRSKGIFMQCFMKDSVLRIAKNPTWRCKVESFRQQLCGIFDQQLKPREAGLAKALLLGYASDVDSSSKAAFSATGAIHVLAVSGMHVALFAQILIVIFGLFHRFIQKRHVQILCLIVLWYYALLTGLSPSVIRSVIMFSLLQFAQILGKESNHNHSLIICAFIMLVFDPNCLLDIGFQLSFFAVIGIFNFQKPLEQLVKTKHTILRFLWSNTCVALAAQALTLPLTLYYFHTFPNYFLIANIGVAVISVAAMYCGFFYLFVCSIPHLGSIAAIPFQFSLKSLHYFLKLVASIPGAIAEGYVISSIICFFLLLAIALLFCSKIPTLLRMVPLTILVIFITVSRNRRQLESHLYLLEGKTPYVVFKNGAYSTVFVPKGGNNNRLKKLCDNYRKIYPTCRMDTVILAEKDSLVLPFFTLQHRKTSLILTIKYRGSEVVDSLHWAKPLPPRRPRKILLD